MNYVIISFDVGGKTYRVSQSLLMKYPTTMLHTASADIETSNINDPIFIDRNGERFQYVIDYMREGQVELPTTVSMDTFLKEMDYFGFDEISLHSIRIYQPYQTVLEEIKYEIVALKQMKHDLTNLENRIMDVHTDHTTKFDEMNKSMTAITKWLQPNGFNVSRWNLKRALDRLPDEIVQKLKPTR